MKKVDFKNIWIAEEITCIENYNGKHCKHCKKEGNLLMAGKKIMMYFQDIDGNEVVLCKDCIPLHWNYAFDITKC